ncbi:MAG: hypothetical protein D6681_16310 [Calditrichaeota bacterium]|nr:MAG: hypothetical protein D6681_16310 [Calditrichota bacterium]
MSGNMRIVGTTNTLRFRNFVGLQLWKPVFYPQNDGTQIPQKSDAISKVMIFEKVFQTIL